MEQAGQMSQYESLCIQGIKSGITVWIQHCHSALYVICYGLDVILTQGGS